RLPKVRWPTSLYSIRRSAGNTTWRRRARVRAIAPMTACSSTARCAPRLWAARLCSANCKSRVSLRGAYSRRSNDKDENLQRWRSSPPTSANGGQIWGTCGSFAGRVELPAMHDADSILTSIFGLEQFRLQQREIVNDVLAGRDSLVVMPTGAGKSLCYQLPAVALRGLTLIISPLIS